MGMKIISRLWHAISEPFASAKKIKRPAVAGQQQAVKLSHRPDQINGEGDLNNLLVIHSVRNP